MHLCSGGWNLVRVLIVLWVGSVDCEELRSEYRIAPSNPGTQWRDSTPCPENPPRRGASFPVLTEAELC